MPDEPLSILLLADDQKGHPNTIHDHIQAFRRHSRHRVELFNPRGLQRSRFLPLDEFDVVVVHYSIVVIWDDYLAPGLRERIAGFDGLKVQLLQDEYRWVDEITAEMRRLGIDLLFTVVDPAHWDAVYGPRLPETELLPTLTGYVPPRLAARKPPPLAGRPIDVGYRGRSLPFWLGRLGFEKIEIGRGFLERARATDLRVDIAWTEGARIHGESWNRFMENCRTMLASESGSSFTDFDGSLVRATRDYIAAHPAAGYEEVEQAVLRRYEPVEIKTVSPRVFEAAASRTAMVMFPGDYNGVVEPWTHYLPLAKDFSNFDEIIDRIRDVPFLEELTERAHRDLIASGAYSEEAWIRTFDDAVSARASPRRRLASYPARLLSLEQLAVGRSYHVSILYGFAREAILAYLGLRAALRRRALRRLVARGRRRGAGDAATTLWDDVFRLAMLTAIHTGSVEPAGGAFAVAGNYDAPRGRLTLTSHRDGARADPELERAVAAALESRALKEIVWNHAAVGQYVTLAVPPLPKRVSFDVGRYDAYGVYRFEFVAALARRDPGVVFDALRPLLATRRGDHSVYRSGAQRS